MSEEKKPAFSNRKIVLAVCMGIVVVVLAILYLRPVIVDFFHKNDLRQKTPGIQTNSAETSPPSSEDKKPKEYRFTDEQINKAMDEVKNPRKNDLPSSQSTEGSSSLYEIEFVSGGRVYSEKVVVTGNMITFENEKGLAVSVNRSEVKSLKKIIQKKRD